MPLSLFYLSLSSLIQNNLNHYLNFLPKVVRENIPTCHLQHLLPWGKNITTKIVSATDLFPRPSLIGEQYSHFTYLLLHSFRKNGT